MTDIIAIQEKLRETSEVLAHLQAEAVNFPGDVSYTQNLKSVEKRRAHLEIELQKAAREMGREVCRYRLVLDNEDGQLPLQGMCGTLSEFQHLLSLVHEANRVGPRTTTKAGDVSARETELDFSYATAGSAVFVFTVPAETNLLESTKIEEAVETVFDAARSRESARVRDFAKQLGSGPIRALYRWASAHHKYSLAAEITWLAQTGKSLQTAVSAQEFGRLVGVLDRTSDETTVEEEHHGVMDGANVNNDTFEFRTDSGPIIRGDAGGLIRAELAVMIPARYTIRVRKTTQVVYSTEQEKVTYRLLHLHPGTVIAESPNRPSTPPS